MLPKQEDMLILCADHGMILQPGRGSYTGSIASPRVRQRGKAWCQPGDTQIFADISATKKIICQSQGRNR